MMYRWCRWGMETTETDNVCQAASPRCSCGECKNSYPGVAPPCGLWKSKAAVFSHAAQHAIETSPLFSDLFLPPPVFTWHLCRQPGVGVRKDTDGCAGVWRPNPI